MCHCPFSTSHSQNLTKTFLKIFLPVLISIFISYVNYPKEQKSPKHTEPLTGPSLGRGTAYRVSAHPWLSLSPDVPGTLLTLFLTVERKEDAIPSLTSSQKFRLLRRWSMSFSTTRAVLASVNSPPALSFPALSIAPNHSLRLGLLSRVLGLGI